MKINCALKECGAIIFDLDGTLWNANKTYLDAWNQALHDYGIPFKITMDAMASVMGKEHDTVMQKFFRHLDNQQRNELSTIITKRQEQYLERWGGNIYPGVIEGIKQLSKTYRLFIVSNCNLHTLKSFFDQSQLAKYFEGYATYNNPHPRKSLNISFCMDKYNMKNPVYIGDTRHDKKACDDAGIQFIQALHGFGETIPGVYAINAVSELVECKEIMN